MDKLKEAMFQLEFIKAELEKAIELTDKGYLRDKLKKILELLE